MNTLIRYAIVDKNMVVSRIAYGMPEGPTEPYSLLVPSQDAQMGMFYDPMREKFSTDRDRNAIASYEELMDSHAEEGKCRRDLKVRIYLEERKTFAQSNLDYINEGLERLASKEELIARIEALEDKRGFGEKHWADTE